MGKVASDEAPSTELVSHLHRRDGHLANKPGGRDSVGSSGRHLSAWRTYHDRDVEYVDSNTTYHPSSSTRVDQQQTRGTYSNPVLKYIQEQLSQQTSNTTNNNRQSNVWINPPQSLQKEAENVGKTPVRQQRWK